jgi:dienelactone hydrolase
MRRLMFGLAIAVAPMAALAGEAVTYQVDGEAFEGYQAAAEGASKGLVVIVHDWDGLTDYEKHRADMLAEMGYDAFAVDLFGKGNRPETTEGKRAETGKLRQDRERMRSLTLGSLEAARAFSDGDAVVIGYCFGGGPALEVARSGQGENIVGYATFHGDIATPEGQSYPADTPPILIAHGGADTSVTMDQVVALSSELESAGVPYEIEIYSGAPHAFTVPGNRYQEAADKKSWDAFSDFLDEQLAG